ncbi:MAG: hypothetical protein V3W44_04300 [Dehalococcoidales bacterium]
MADRALSSITDADERRWAIEEAARTLTGMVSLEKDRELLAAAQKEVERIAEEAATAAAGAARMKDAGERNFVDSVSSQSASLQN